MRVTYSDMCVCVEFLIFESKEEYVEHYEDKIFEFDNLCRNVSGKDYVL